MYNMHDKDILKILKSEEERQRSTLEMIASENFTSAEVMIAQGSVLTNKYAEGYPSKRYYGGCEFVDEAEELAKERACELLAQNLPTYNLIQAQEPTWLYIMRY